MRSRGRTETQKRIHDISREGDSAARKQATQSRVTTEPQLAQGLACTPSEEIDVTKPYLSILKPGIDPSLRAGGDAKVLRREVNGRLSMAEIPLFVFSLGWGGLSLSLRSICASRLD